MHAPMISFLLNILNHFNYTKMTKSALKEALEASFMTIASETAHLDEAKFFAPIGEKWSVAENMLHLTQSAKSLNQGMALPKSVLEQQFGKIDRPVMSYDEVVARYLDALGTGIKARGAFLPVLPENPSKDILLSSFVKHHQLLANFLDDWSETELDELNILHPVLKKLTIREVYFFMHYHTGHHSNAIAKAL